jgi:hypothetical protein
MITSKGTCVIISWHIIVRESSREERLFVGIGLLLQELHALIAPAVLIDDTPDYNSHHYFARAHIRAMERTAHAVSFCVDSPKLLRIFERPVSLCTQACVRMRFHSEFIG